MMTKRCSNCRKPLSASTGYGLSDLKRDTADLREPRDVLEVLDLADEHFEWVGQGEEAIVYAVDDRTVLKVSEKKRNLKTEYEAFADSAYSAATPEVRGRHGQWLWIAVERVNPLKTWLDLWLTLPSTAEELASHRGHAESRDYREDEFYEAFPRIQKGREPDWLWEISSEERQFFLDVADLHSDYGLKALDMVPKNLGVDDTGNPVVIDLYTSG